MQCLEMRLPPGIEAKGGAVDIGSGSQERTIIQIMVDYQPWQPRLRRWFLRVDGWKTA